MVGQRLAHPSMARSRPQQQLKRFEQKKTLKVVYEAMHAAKREDVKLERKIKEENLSMVRRPTQGRPAPPPPTGASVSHMNLEDRITSVASE